VAPFWSVRLREDARDSVSAITVFLPGLHPGNPDALRFRRPAECSMSSLLKFISSSVGTKILIGLTGLAFFGFLVIHLAGNLLILTDPDGFNAYSEHLVRNPLLPIAELGLLAIFVVHAYKAVATVIRNQHARPVSYEKKKWAGHTSRKSVASSTMIVTGTLILLFVVIHLAHFKFGTYYRDELHGYRDLARLVFETFVQPVWVIWYVVVMTLIGFHLRHGIGSAFQSLGLEHPRYNAWARAIGVVLAVLVAGGFALIPIWIYVTGGRS
jgi:succinate dehydrogenase cytochrome b subunit